MGIIGPAGHEGFAACVFADGKTGGSYMGNKVAASYAPDGTFLDLDDWRSEDQVVGYVAQCECGWKGQPWTRIAEGGVQWPNELSHTIYSEDVFLNEDAEDLVMREWHAHVRAPMRLEDVADAAAKAAEAAKELDEAVAEARAAGATWADVGRAVGITRQSARERWAARLGDAREY